MRMIALLAALLLIGCASPAADQAAREAHLHRLYVGWVESGEVPRKGEDGVTHEPLSIEHMSRMVRAGARAWEAQAYYLGSGPRPAWLTEEGGE